MTAPRAPHSDVRHRLHEIIFEADTTAGKAFDVVLLVCIAASVVSVMLESVASVAELHGTTLYTIEWILTIMFTVEYALRLYCVGRPWRYATSFFGVVDLLSVVPTYLSVFIGGAQSLLVVRALRLLRVFRVFKMARFLGEAEVLRRALGASARKIMVFLGTVLTAVVIIAAVMYLVEDGTAGFENIPASIYWAIVTMTTVGYGDVVPATIVGKFLASGLMILGYGIIAVPTGIVSVELASAVHHSVSTQACRHCSLDGHDADAVHCKYCGEKL